VAVLSGENGCVVARSKEVKDIGVPVGAPYFQIKDRLDSIKANIFTTNFPLYRDISKRVLDVVNESVLKMEIYSIDECFFIFESNNPDKFISELKTKVETLVGVPVSIACAPSKTICKYANTIAKKTNGHFVLTKKEWLKKVFDIRMGEIWGVGLSRTRQMNEKQISFVSDFLKLEDPVIKNLFGVEGARLKLELSGDDSLSLSLRTKNKSMMSSCSFQKESYDLVFLETAVKKHVHELALNLKEKDLITTSVQVYIAPSRHGDFFLQGASNTVDLIQGTNNLFLLQETALKLLRQAFSKGVPYKKAGVLFSHLVPNDVENLVLFEDDLDFKIKTSNLSDVVYSINKKLGRNKVQLGLTGKEKTEKVSALRSQSYTTKWSDIKLVLAG